MSAIPNRIRITPIHGYLYANGKCTYTGVLGIEEMSNRSTFRFLHISNTKLNRNMQKIIRYPRAATAIAAMIDLPW